MVSVIRCPVTVSAAAVAHGSTSRATVETSARTIFLMIPPERIGGVSGGPHTPPGYLGGQPARGPSPPHRSAVHGRVSRGGMGSYAEPRHRCRVRLGSA